MGWGKEVDVSMVSVHVWTAKSLRNIAIAHENAPLLAHPPYIPPSPPPISKTKLMDPLWPHIVILRATHKPLTQPLIHPKHHLRRDLRAQERRLLRPHILPLGEILRHPGDLDACGRLVVAGLFRQVLLPVVGVVLLELELLV